LRERVSGERRKKEASWQEPKNKTSGIRVNLLGKKLESGKDDEYR